MTRTVKMLAFDCIGHALATNCKGLHPQAEMRRLGITYKEAIPQSMYDAWHFLFCENVPDDLPDWIERIEEIPPAYRKTGHGRSQEAIDRNGC